MDRYNLLKFIHLLHFYVTAHIKYRLAILLIYSSIQRIFVASLLISKLCSGHWRFSNVLGYRPRDCPLGLPCQNATDWVA